MLGNSTQKTFLSIVSGKIRHTSKDGSVQTYDTIEGVLTEIGRRTRDINGRPTKILDLNIKDGNENYCVSVIADSGVARSLVCSLYGITDFVKPVRIVTRLKVVNGQEYTNVYVYSGGQQAKWAIELPAPEQFKLPTGEVHTSYKKREDVLEKCIDEINSRLHGAEEPIEEDDLPAGDISGEDGMAFLNGEAEY